jgi:putative membrane protein
VVLVPLGLAMLLYATAYLLGYPGTATIIVVGVIGCYLLFKGFGIDEIVHGILDALRTSLSRGRFSFVTYSATILLVIIGFVNGFITMLKYYSGEEGLGILIYLMTFIYGAIEWLLFAGIVVSLGIIIDVYLNEREQLGKVIVFPFFFIALGLILYGASVYLISVNGVPEFPLSQNMAGSYILYATIAGLISAVIGVMVQFVVNKKLAEQRRQAIIEVL